MDSLRGYVAKGYQQISGLSTAKGLTVPQDANGVNTANVAVIIPQTQAVRFRDDGTAPTATVGMPIAVAQEFIYTGPLSNIQFFEQTASAVLNVSYYFSPGMV